MKYAYAEKKLQGYMCDKWNSIFPHLTLIQINPNIYGVCSNKIIGQADFLFRRHKKLYLAELKHGQDKSTDLWTSLKVIGYAKMFELRSCVPAKPVIIVKKSIITNDTRTLFYALKVNYITFELTKDGYFFEYDFE